MNGINPKTRWNLVYWILAAMAFLTLQSLWQASRTIEPVPYSEFEKALAEGRVSEVVVGETTITGKLKSPDGGKTTIVANRVEPDLAERLSKYDVPYTRVVESTFLRDCCRGWCRRWSSSACGSSSCAGWPRSRAASAAS